MKNDLIVRRDGREYVIPRGIEAEGGAAIEDYVAAWGRVDFAGDRALEVAVDLELEPEDFEGRTGTGADGAFRADDVRAIAEERAAEAAADDTTDSGGDG